MSKQHAQLNKSLIAKTTTTRPIKQKFNCQNLKLLISFFALFIILNSLFITPVYAACKTDANEDCLPAGLEEIEGIFNNFISVFAGFAFVALLVLAITAGFKYLTSGGEPKAVSAAHQTLSWALLGIFMLAIAWIVLQLVFALTGVDVTAFDVKTLCKDPNDATKWFCGP